MHDDPSADALLGHVAALQSLDEAVAAGIDAVADLLVRSDHVRERAAAVLEALAVLPRELARNDEAAAEARRREQVARAELAVAESRVEEAAASRRGGDEARAQAQRELTRAREQLADAGAAVVRIAARRNEIVDTEPALRAEGDGLAVAARGIAMEIRATPRVSVSGREEPGTALADLVAWGARVHAALFVVRCGLESERDRIVVEASALAASVLGEQHAGASVSLVRRQLETHLRNG